MHLRSPSRLSQPGGVHDLFLYRISHLLAVAGGPVIRLCEGRFGITRREWRVLALLAQNEGLLSSQLAERAQLDRARTSRAITSLVGKKLAQRQSQAADRRQAVVVLSAAGRALYEELFPLVRQVNAELMACLDEATVQRLDQALDLLQHQADGLAGSGRLPKANRRAGGRVAPALRG